MTDSPSDPADPSDRAPLPAPASFARVVWFIVAVLAARIVYLVLLSPWRLVADEAQYWQWSRRLDWSYYTKGPGVAWAIAASTRLFGDHEWAIRLPSAIAAAVMCLAGARLAYGVVRARDDYATAVRAAWFAAVALAIVPGFCTTAQLLTPDMFYASAWLVGAWCAYRAVRAASTAGSLLAWAGVGAAIGVGFLFKYTAFLFVPGLIAWLFASRRAMNVAARRRAWVGIAIMLLTFAAVASPIAIWNAQRGWPTIAHQLGRIQLPGGDEKVSWTWSPMWFVSFVGAQLGILALFGAILIWLSLSATRDRIEPLGRSLLIWLAVPILGGYVALSVVKNLQGNWSIAGYTTPLVLVGIALSGRSLSKMMRDAWSWFVGISVVVCLCVMFGPWLMRLPGVNRVATARALDRHTGGAAVRFATLVQTRREGFATTPILVCNSYQDASQLGFYLPDKPLTYVARHLMGGRPTPWDFFADTDLHDPKLIGRDALLIGSSRKVWEATLVFDSIEALPGSDDPKMSSLFRAINFRGPRATTQPTAVDRDDDSDPS